MSLTAFAFAVLAAAPAVMLSESPELAARPLAAGRANEALATLERASLADPHDPAVLINLGIAYARAGEDAEARAAFGRALACENVIELETADGSTTDSRRLAMKAMRMLDRGEFRTAAGTNADRLTYRN